MSKGIIGKKIGMSQQYNGGELIPVTVIQAGPCAVVQKKTAAKDGYESVQLAFEEEKNPVILKPYSILWKYLGSCL